MKVAVLGAGAWGTALGKVLSDNQHTVSLWAREASLLNAIASEGENSRYLPGVSLPADWCLEANLNAVAQGAEVLVVAVPSKGFREVIETMGSFSGPIVTVTKGIEFATGLTMSGVLESVFDSAVPVALSGPTIAKEVVSGMPAAIVAAGRHSEAVVLAQTLFHRPTFRVYASSDILGVELGGALKNVIAIAAGISEGLGFGDNSKAALLTRGLAEMRRLGVAVGAQGETFNGLSGLGDLTVTCFSPHSRNRTFGEALGRGGSAEELLAGRRSVVEGMPTARSARQLAQKHRLDTPIIDEVYAMLYENKPVKAALESLLAREAKYED